MRRKVNGSFDEYDKDVTKYYQKNKIVWNVDIEHKIQIS